MSYLLIGALLIAVACILGYLETLEVRERDP